MQLTLCTAGGEQHGLINTLTNCVPFDDFKSFKPEHKKEMERSKKENAQIKKVEYMNSKGGHERLTKPYCAGSGEPIQIWHFIPGKVYEIPLGLIKEVNEKTEPMKREGLLSLDDKPVNRDGSPLSKDKPSEWVHRFVAAAI